MSPPRHRGKHGPCGHCGIETTPLWRNGPPEKPVLCNACGSRWRTKGTLLNYMPMHSGGFGGAGSKEGVAHRKKGSHKLSSDPPPRSHKHKDRAYEAQAEIRTPASLHPLLLKDAEEELKTASSLESGVFGSDRDALSRSSPVQVDSSAGLGWVGPIPSRKRTPMVRACTSLEKLISHFQELMNESPTLSYPTSAEEELLMEINKVVAAPLNEAPARGKEKPPHFWKKMEEMGYLHSDHHLVPNEALSENFPYNKQDVVLQGCQSPIVLNLEDILNFDTYTGLLSDQEQRQLAKLLSSVDINRIPESLKEMFNSRQFDRALANLQQLLSDAMFDSLEPGMDAGILQHFQQLLTASNLNSSGRMERSSHLRIHNKQQSGSSDFSKNKELIKDKINGRRVPWVVGSGSIKNSLGTLPGRSGPCVGDDIHAGGTYKKNKCVSNLLPYCGLSPLNYAHGLKSGTADIGRSSNDGVIATEVGETCFADNAVSVDDLPDLQTVPGSDGMEPDLLFDLSSSIFSFHEAELLQQPVWTKSREESESNQIENGGLIMSNIWHMDNNLFELFWNPLCGSPGNGCPTERY